MASVRLMLHYFFLLIITFAEGEKKSVNKIIIHVPYKILKHYHTHTKYKMITVPLFKNKNSIIYLKDENQPDVKQDTQIQIHEMVEPKKKMRKTIISPQQESAPALLESIVNHLEGTNHQYSTAVNKQKPTQLQSQNTETFVPDMLFKPMVFPSNNIIQPVMLSQKAAFPPNFLINQIMHQPDENYIPKFINQPMFHLPQVHYNSRVISPLKALQDNTHTGSEVHKTIIPPGAKTTSYKVKEDDHEDHKRQPFKKITKVTVPLLKPAKEPKSYLVPSRNLRFKSTRTLMPFDPDYEYDHVGYLIIDGNSRIIVGKN